MENIDFFLQECKYTNDDYNETNDISDFLKEFDMIQGNVSNTQIMHSIDSNENSIFAQMKNYDLNYNIKQLGLVCEYYGLAKCIRLNKMKKQEIIEQIILFENNTDNIEIVIKRKELWYYLNELKNDKMMKKYVLW
jgi:hypothetical protein